MTSIDELNPGLEGIGRYEFGWHDPDVAGAAAKRGLNEAVVRDISGRKNEPAWMLDLRLKGLKLFDRKPMPTWGADLSSIDFDNIKYYVESAERQATSWEELPEDIKNTYDKLGIPEAEKQRLVAGVAAQYESTVLTNAARDLGGNLLHLHTFGSHVLGVRVASALGIPVVRTEHDVAHYEDPSRNRFTRWAMRRTHAVIAISAFVERAEMWSAASPNAFPHGNAARASV